MKNILTQKVFYAMLIIAAVLMCTTLAFIIIWRPAAGRPSLTPAPVVLIVIPAFTSTPLASSPTQTSYPPSPVFTPTPAPGQIAVGVYVQPSTGGEGLRIHVAPSLSAALAFPEAAFDSEVFLVTDGPKQADDYTWWYLTASYDATRAGWAVQNYLVAIPTSH